MNEFHWLVWNLGSSALQTSISNGECNDMHGQTIEQGRHYVPGPDICKLVLCFNANKWYLKWKYFKITWNFYWKCVEFGKILLRL